MNKLFIQDYKRFTPAEYVLLRLFSVYLKITNYEHCSGFVSISAAEDRSKQ